MANVIIVLILVAAVGYGIYSFIHHLRHGGGCCGEHDAPAKKVRAADTEQEPLSAPPRHGRGRHDLPELPAPCGKRIEHPARHTGPR